MNNYMISLFVRHLAMRGQIIHRCIESKKILYARTSGIMIEDNKLIIRDPHYPEARDVFEIDTGDFYFFEERTEGRKWKTHELVGIRFEEKNYFFESEEDTRKLAQIALNFLIEEVDELNGLLA